MPGESHEQRSPASRLLIGVGLLLLVLCAVVAIRRQDVLASALAVLGLGAIIVGVLVPRLEGPVELGPSGLKLQVVAAAAGYSQEVLQEAIAAALTERGSASWIEESTHRAPASLEHGAVEISDLLAGSVSSAPDNEAALAQALLERWERTQVAEDLAEAVAHAERALAQTPPGSSARPPLLLLLAYASLADYQFRGDRGLLERAIEAARSALKTTVQDSPAYESAIRLLAAALQERYGATGALEDQDEAIASLRRLEEVRRRRGTHTDTS